MSETRHRTTLDGESVVYQLRRSSEATRARIDVDLTGVTVVVPTDATHDPETHIARAERLLQDNAAWTLRKVAKFEQYRERVPDRTFASGETLPYLGDETEIVVEQRSYSEVVDDQFRLARWEVERTSVKNVLESLYQRKARAHFEGRVEHFAEQMDVDYGQIHIRNQRTRWGSCSTSGTLSFNWRLLLAPPEIVDYVVVHELAHLIEANHSQRFWDLVAEYDPDWETHSDWLDRHGIRLVFDESDL